MTAALFLHEQATVCCAPSVQSNNAEQSIIRGWSENLERASLSLTTPPKRCLFSVLPTVLLNTDFFTWNG